MHAGDYIEPITNTSVQLSALMTKEETQHPRLRGLSEAPLFNTLFGTLLINNNNVGCSYYIVIKKNRTVARLYGNHIDLAAHFSSEYRIKPTGQTTHYKTNSRGY